MPGVDKESGRGLALARTLLDDFGYERDGDVNRWRLVKKL
jgi:anti-sigma regulatory factor (Ser/Thr protein kinase)